MEGPRLIIISGPPCTGKTSLGRRLANDLRLPFFNKDTFKELLFDRLGWSDREWSKRLGLASYDLLYACTEILLEAGVSLIVESNFKDEFDTPKFIGLMEKVAFTPVQVLCRSRGEILFERFRQRADAGQRHPGHVDHLTLEELRAVLLEGAHRPLALGGQVIEVDTTDFDRIDYPALLKALTSSPPDNPANFQEAA